MAKTASAQSNPQSPPPAQVDMTTGGEPQGRTTPALGR